MHRISRLVLVVALGISYLGASACGAESGDSVSGTPALHRAVASQCDDERAPGRPVYLSPTECSSDADCRSGRNGRCQSNGIDSVCTYDVCRTDADCAPSELCECGPADAANVCIAAACHIDADCGPVGYCSPIWSCGKDSGYYCHTASDACGDDRDCTNNDYCNFDRTLGYWRCVAIICPET